MPWSAPLECDTFLPEMKSTDPHHRGIVSSSLTQKGEVTVGNQVTAVGGVGPACVVLAMLLIGTCAYAAATPQVKQINVLGTAVVSKGNMAKSRQSAVDDALVAAVGQAVMEMLTGETVAQRFQLINEQILSQKEKYIPTYRILTESVYGKTITTLVQVDVSVNRLNEDLLKSGVVASNAEDAGTLFTITVTGTSGQIASFVRLRTTIATMSGVKELKMTAMSADQASMTVNYQGNTRSLADALLMQSFDGFAIEIVEVTPELVQLQLKQP
jgi:hypothetical protein